MRILARAQTPRRREARHARERKGGVPSRPAVLAPQIPMGQVGQQHVEEGVSDVIGAEVEGEGRFFDVFHGFDAGGEVTLAPQIHFCSHDGSRHAVAPILDAGRVHEMGAVKSALVPHVLLVAMIVIPPPLEQRRGARTASQRVFHEGLIVGCEVDEALDVAVGLGMFRETDVVEFDEARYVWVDGEWSRGQERWKLGRCWRQCWRRCCGILLLRGCFLRPIIISTYIDGGTTVIDTIPIVALADLLLLLRLLLPLLFVVRM